MSVVLTLIAIAALALCLLVWLISRLRDGGGLSASAQADLPAPEGKPLAERLASAVSASKLSKQELEAHADIADESNKDVNFRPQGERGMGGPLYGDVMCSDGVYLPHVWEMDMHTSYDGRWLRTGFYDSELAHLVDRKSRRSWLITKAEGALLDAIHWRMPRWSGESINESGIADDAHVILSDINFDVWLGEHVAAAAQPLVQVVDLWVPAESLPTEVGRPMPVLPQPSQPTAVPQLTLKRHWPASLRKLRYPMAPLQNPHWQLMLGESLQPWGLDESHSMVWRADAQAFALYAYPTQGDASQNSLRLVAWTMERGWQQWPDLMPEDSKPWALGLCWKAGEAQAEEAGSLELSWNQDLILQRVSVDIPDIERLHDGTNISCIMSETEVCVGHERDGLPMLKPSLAVAFDWLRDPAQPALWRAQSEPLKGQRMIWTLAKPAKDELGETAAYNLQWGERHLPGAWALEHVIVQGRWAILMPHGRAPMRGGSGSLQVWDGERLQSIDLPWPVVRLQAVPALKGTQKGDMAARVRVVALTASLADKDWDPSTASWRWPLQSVSASHLARPDWRPLYAERELAPDVQGRWQLLPRWRSVKQIQHPCADGDYVWRDEVRGDSLWWWGGVNEGVNSYWQADELRKDGVAMTRSGLALCGVGPCACPHPSGEGWAVLEPVESRYGELGLWKLHWLNPVEKELRTLEIKARMPVLKSWDAQGLHWQDEPLLADEEQAATEPGASTGQPGLRQLLVSQSWQRASVEPLRQGVNGLWLRKQDLRYAEALQGQDDAPWGR